MQTNINYTLFSDLLRALSPIAEIDESAVRNLLKAYEIAYRAHHGVLRDGGKEYITHPVECCIIMATEFGIKNPLPYVALLLHDVGEDTAVFGDMTRQRWNDFQSTLLQMATDLFDRHVARIVPCLTKPCVNMVDFGTKGQVNRYYYQGFRSCDFEVRHFSLLCKMIDRLHNLRSLPLDDKGRIIRTASETRRDLLPLFSHIMDQMVSAGTGVPAGLMEDQFEMKFKEILAAMNQELERLLSLA